MSTSEKPRILALDYGKQRVGVAISDLLRITAQPRETLHIKNSKDAVNQIRELVRKESAECIVLGLPKNLSGDIEKMGKEVQEFGAMLTQELGISVHYLDERLTSVQAKKAMHAMNMKPSKNKAKVDSLSAVFILQTYLALNA